MTAVPPRALTLGAAAAAGVFSYVGISSGLPTLWSPFPEATVVPLFWVLNGVSGHPRLDSAAIFAVPAVVGPLVFALAAPHLFWGEAAVPWRSRIGLVVLTVLNAVYFVAGWRYGLEYQGVDYVVAIAGINLAAIAGCWLLLLRALRYPSFRASVLFHWCTVVWFVWLAFPWLGENL